MREERYVCEQQIREEQRAVKMLRDEVDGDSRKLNELNDELETYQKDLCNFMVKKFPYCFCINFTYLSFE